MLESSSQPEDDIGEAGPLSLTLSPEGERESETTFLHPLPARISWWMDDSPDDFAFDPVPSASTRHDGWTPERQRGFIHALSQIGMVAAAARHVGMSRKSAYALLARAGPESGFARAWREAQALGRRTAYDTAIERAISGIEQPVYYRGVRCGTRRIYHNGLLLAALRATDRMSRNRRGR